MDPNLERGRVCVTNRLHKDMVSLALKIYFSIKLFPRITPHLNSHSYVPEFLRFRLCLFYMSMLILISLTIY